MDRLPNATFNTCTAVDDWLASGRKFISMRDNMWHNIQILGGMWGGRSNSIPDVAERLDRFKNDGMLL